MIEFMFITSLLLFIASGVLFHKIRMQRAENIALLTGMLVVIKAILKYNGGDISIPQLYLDNMTRDCFKYNIKKEEHSEVKIITYKLEEIK